jgi:ParB-like chromosome segregation protein Spo0J
VAATAFKGDGEQGGVEVELVAIDWLKPHEEVRWNKVEELAKVTERWGCFTKPLLIDSETGAILDGHHRHQVGIRLGLNRLPVILFDYLADERITVEAWPNADVDHLSKADIIEMSLSDNLYPPKTSKHTIEEDTPPISVSLQRLVDKAD